MQTKYFKYDLLLLLTAFIWGMGFVAQRLGMAHAQPLMFNSLRFFLGAGVLIFFLKTKLKWEWIKKGFYLGFVMFLASGLQQIGLVYTSASKAGFITGLYVVLVPVLGIFIKHKASKSIWFSALLACIGLFLISGLSFNNLVIAKGDFFVILAAFFWALQIIKVDKFLKNTPAIPLAFLQFVFCGIFGFIASVVLEPKPFVGITQAGLALAFSGVFSVGVAFTLQIVGQKKVPTSHAAVIMSLETVFAAIGGYLILHERLSSKALIGCILMLLAMLWAQLFRR